MAPLVPALAQSESKTRFFQRLGLDPHNPLHKRVYALMKMEAAEGRRRLMEGQNSDTAQIHEVAWSREVMHIYTTAGTETKAVYQFGLDTENRTDQPDNWIIRWLLWHVFRYRDYRNKGRAPGSMSAGAPGYTSSDGEDSTPAPSTSNSPVTARNASGSSGQTTSIHGASNLYWDPIRERWQNS